MTKPFQLPKQFFNLWIEALESGLYEQGNDALVRIKSVSGGSKFQYCCLGVACIVAGLSPNVIPNNTQMPHEIEELLKPLPFPELLLMDDLNLSNLLSAMNDGILSSRSLAVYKDNYPGLEVQYTKGRRYTFDEIAKFLKENVEPI